jgi:tRNA U34 5-carboxymethylaminomethyl modifying GTPase MnmE/TrmE
MAWAYAIATAKKPSAMAIIRTSIMDDLPCALDCCYYFVRS